MLKLKGLAMTKYNRDPSIMLLPDGAVLNDFVEAAPTPTIRAWYYAWQTKHRYIAFDKPRGTWLRNGATWLIAVPDEWNLQGITFAPCWTYMFGWGEWMNPDFPAYVAGDFKWEIDATAILPGTDLVSSNYSIGMASWTVPSVNDTKLVYMPTAQTIIPANPSGVSLTNRSALRVDLWRTDVVERVIDLFGILMTPHLT